MCVCVDVCVHVHDCSMPIKVYAPLGSAMLVSPRDLLLSVASWPFLSTLGPEATQIVFVGYHHLLWLCWRKTERDLTSHS